MEEGAIFDYTIKLGLIKFPWKTLITRYDPPFVFQDIQTFGPYKKWEHTHEFIDMGDRTKIIDTIEYDLFPKFLSKSINRLFIRKRVLRIHLKQVENQSISITTKNAWWRRTALNSI